MSLFRSSKGSTESLKCDNPSLISPTYASHRFPRAWLAKFARKSILSALRTAITTGQVVLSEGDTVTAYGTHKPGRNPIHIHVNHQEFWLRLMCSGDVGFSEAFMSSDIEISDLQGAMEIWLDNQIAMERMLTSPMSRASSVVTGLFNLILGQTKHRARLSAIASYDQSNELFKSFLSKEMMYSCALWGNAEGGVVGDLRNGPRPGDLEDAQRRKIHHVLRTARVRPGHRVLEFGSGWGGLAIEAARMFGCEVDTLTLSVKQKELAEERINAAGLQDKIRVHLMDYRDIPDAWEKAFDVFISIEMIEHVGANNYSTYFKLVDFALKTQDSVAIVTGSMFPEDRYSRRQPEDFMRRYMWPNSSLPSVSVLIDAAQKGGKGSFVLESVENHSAHYPRTLREWARRLDNNMTPDIISKEYPALNDPASYDAFIRKWRYLFAYAGAGFNKGYITCYMLNFARKFVALARRSIRVNGSKFCVETWRENPTDILPMDDPLHDFADRYYTSIMVTCSWRNEKGKSSV
ncbi:hypothetical protein PQX77_005508 [Marasmius sp. AFHP31]|nr:hypothetical protein PQX77_005508 [Marasmius sp. AFHP31]